MERTFFHETMPTDISENNSFGSPSKMKDVRENACSSSYITDFPGNLCAEREKSVRRSPTSNDEFWDALSSHYDYLMDDGLIATCREANSDLSLDDEDVVTNIYCWSFAQFIEHFKQLHDKLHDLQVAMEGGHRENQNLLEEQKKVASYCKNFNDQGQKLIEKYPDMRDEVNRHLNLLNNKWNAVEQAVNPKNSQPGKDSTLNEISTLVRCLRRWLKELEDRLCPVPLLSKWTLEKLEEKRQEQEVLQKEIKAKGKYVSTLLKRFECLDGNETLGCSPLKWNAERFHRVATNLQKHWLSIYLRSLEHQAIIENLMFRKNTVSAEKLDFSISDEPVKKYPRLDEDAFMILDHADIDLKFEDQEFLEDDCGPTHITPLQSCRKESSVYTLAKDLRSSTNDKGIMVGNTGIAELKAGYKGKIGKFELVQDVGYSSETSAHLSNDEQVEASDGSFHFESDSGKGHKLSPTPESSINYQKCSSHSTPKHTAFRKPHLPPDKYPTYFNHFTSVTESLSKLLPQGSTPKAVPNSFYKMTALDLEGAEDAVGNSVSRSEPKNKLLCNKDSAMHSDPLLAKDSRKCIQSINSTDSCKVQTSLASSIPAEFGHPVVTDAKGHYSEKSKRKAKVTEWLNNYHAAKEDITSVDGGEFLHRRSSWCKDKVVADSCDASGEYTTTESDGEKSCVSDDVNNSLTLSQSFTGSVETVVKAVKEEVKSHSDRAGSAEPEPSLRVQMRKKKFTRDRPRSVTELHQVATQPSSVTHSTSEGALNAISYSAHDSTKSTPCSKKIRLGFKKSSLTDVSVGSFSATKEKRRFSQSRSHGSTDRSDECFSSKEESVVVNHGESNTALSSRKSNSSYSSERNSASSISSTVSKSRGQKHKRRFRSCHSESSTKVKSNSEESSVERKTCNESYFDGKKKRSPKCNKNACPEDQSSASEPVWDEYQDPPYLSEPYSEQTADEDQVKRLTNFGDDYRDILGSHSDGSSAWSTCKMPTRSRARSVHLLNKDISAHRMDLSNCASDTDDTEDFHNILDTSTKALHYVQSCIKENNTKKNFPLSSKYSEVLATCQTHLHSLREIYEEVMTKPDFQLAPGDMQRLQGLIREWEVLQAKLVHLSHYGDISLSNDSIQNSILEVQNTMSTHKTKLNRIWSCASEALTGITTAKKLQENIVKLQTSLTNLQEMKGSVLSVSARVLRLMAEGATEAVFPLRDAAAKLYQQWEDVYELSSSQLTKLQSMQSEWKENLDSGLNECTGAVGHRSDPSEAPKCKILKQHADSNRSKSLCLGQEHEKHYHQSLSKQNGSDKDLEDMLPLYSSEFSFRNMPEGTEGTNGKSPWPFINTRSRLWRALRASMPFHLALVISYCISCLMEPQCCENINSLDFSIFPQLRHMQGPPPV